MGKEEAPDLTTRGLTPSAYLRPGYPLVGCSPAEPTSVSPGETNGIATASRTQEQGKVAGQEGQRKCSEEMPDFCPKNGVHFRSQIQGRSGRGPSDAVLEQIAQSNCYSAQGLAKKAWTGKKPSSGFLE
jgi:hypothetical protein